MPEIIDAAPNRKVRTDPGGFLRPAEYAIASLMTITEPNGPRHFVRLRSFNGNEVTFAVDAYKGLEVNDVVKVNIVNVMTDNPAAPEHSAP